MKRAFQMLACLSVVAWSVGAYGADVRGDKSPTLNTHRATKLVGMSVRNAQGEKLGTVDDLVINMQNGQVAYAALGFGGVLGFGEKLFAVPFNQMKFEHGSNNEDYFVINMTKEKLKAAPGFDKNHWPNLADPNWSQDIDNYYRHATTTTTTKDVKTSNKQ